MEYAMEQKNSVHVWKEEYRQETVPPRDNPSWDLGWGISFALSTSLTVGGLGKVNRKWLAGEVQQGRGSLLSSHSLCRTGGSWEVSGGEQQINRNVRTLTSRTDHPFSVLPDLLPHILKRISSCALITRGL